jgi:hypothetical protein
MSHETQKNELGSLGPSRRRIPAPRGQDEEFDKLDVVLVTRPMWAPAAQAARGFCTLQFTEQGTMARSLQELRG